MFGIHRMSGYEIYRTNQLFLHISKERNFMNTYLFFYVIPNELFCDTTEFMERVIFLVVDFE